MIVALMFSLLVNSVFFFLAAKVLWDNPKYDGGLIGWIFSGLLALGVVTLVSVIGIAIKIAEVVG